MAKYIFLRPFGEIGKEVLEELKENLGKIFLIPIHFEPPRELPINAYFRRRKQWHSTTILERAINIDIPDDAERVLGIVDVDLFVEGMNFVFGEADPQHGTAVISVFRLRPEYYLLPPNEELFYERVVKEAVHELGHTYGLGHCSDPRCVMYFSNTLADTDGKGPGFCEKCDKTLASLLLKGK